MNNMYWLKDKFKITIIHQRLFALAKQGLTDNKYYMLCYIISNRSRQNPNITTIDSLRIVSNSAQCFCKKKRVHAKVGIFCGQIILCYE